jgi:hypothetical protein
MPYYPIPALLGIGLNLVLTLVLVVFLVRTDPLALVLSVGWLALGVVAYGALTRARDASRIDDDTSPGPEPLMEDD